MLLLKTLLYMLLVMSNIHYGNHEMN